MTCIINPKRSVFHFFIYSFSLFSVRNSGHFSMLGLGDIVMPGLLLCFVLRFDAYKKAQLAITDPNAPAPASFLHRITYFHCSLVGYFLGKT